MLKDIIREHRPVVVILLEPSISGDTVDAVCKSLGKKRCIR